MTTETRPTSRLRHDPLVRGLGWASAILGVPQVVAPADFTRALGVGDAPRHRSATTAVGVRELAAATWGTPRSALAQPRPRTSGSFRRREVERVSAVISAPHVRGG